MYKCEFKILENKRIDLNYNDDTRKINIDAQNLYRNLKVYDYLIDFILINKDFFIKIKTYGNQSDDNVPECIKIIRKIWKKIFRVLEYMTKDNSETQGLMWKYKDEFTMKELGSRMQEGELDFVLAIIDDSPEAVKLNQNKLNVSRSRFFVNCLRARMNDKENFVILLEIFNKLIKFQAFSFLRQPLTRLVLDKPEFIVSYDKDVERDFVRALNTQEIIYSIISNKKMKFMRKFLKSYFPLKDMLKHIESSVQKLGELEDKYKDSNRNMDTEDYDELRDYQYFDLVNIYIQVYLNTKYSTTNKEDIANDFVSYISVDYIQMLNNFNQNSDFSNLSTVKRSTLRFLMIYMNLFLISMKRFMNISTEFTTNKSFIVKSGVQNEFLSQIVAPKTIQNAKNQIAVIEDIYSEILNRLENSNQEGLQEILQEIYFHKNKDIANIFRRVGSTKFNNSRSVESSTFNNIWCQYANYISSSREGRTLVDKEHYSFVNVIFNTITNESSHPLTVQSYKKFISGGISFMYLTQSSNISLYMIIFLYKIYSMLLSLSSK